MTRENEFFFLWERRIVGFEIRGVLVGNEIAFGRAVGGVVDAVVDSIVDAVGLEPAGDELLGEEIGDFGVAGFGVVVYAETACRGIRCRVGGLCLTRIEAVGGRSHGVCSRGGC